MRGGVLAGLLLLGACTGSSSPVPATKWSTTAPPVSVPVHPVISPYVSGVGAGAVVVSTSTAVIVAGGATADYAEPLRTVRRWDRSANSWSDLPPLPGRYLARFGAVLQDRPVLVASYCPGEEPVGDSSETCAGDRILLLNQAEDAWDTVPVPTFKFLVHLSTGWAGALGDHLLVMVPQSITHIAMITFDVRTRSFTTSPPPDGPSGFPFEWTSACATAKTMFLRSWGSVWALDGRAWTHPSRLSLSTLGPTYGGLCNPGGYYVVGSKSSMRVDLTSGTITARTATAAGLDPPVGYQVARKNGMVYAISANGDLVAIPLPRQVTEVQPSVGADQNGRVVDLVFRRNAKSTAIKVVSLAVPD